MSDTYTRLLYHMCFSTKNHELWLSPEIEMEVHAYLAGLMQNAGAHVYKVNGMEDHIHCVVQLPPTIAVSTFLRDLKAYSSGWFKRRFGRAAFAWQRGYGAFTVSPSQLNKVITYVANQKEHHSSGLTYVEEFRNLLAKHGIPFEESMLD